MNTKPIECPACGAVALSLRTGPGRTAWHRNMLVAVPADFPLPECSACGARPLTARTVAALEPHLEAAWVEQTRLIARADIDTLAKTKPLYAWERLLNLSPGYLSKLRGRKQPSGPLVALLRLLANDVSRAAELEGLWAGAPAEPVDDGQLLRAVPQTLEPPPLRSVTRTQFEVLQRVA